MEIKSNTSKDEDKKELSELDKLKQERDEYLNGWKRAKADLLNYQKEEVKRIDEILKFGNESLIKELLPVLDSFDLSLLVMEKADTGIKKGVEIIQSQLEQILNRHGLEPVPALDAKFDPSVHESIEEVESDKEAGIVVEELVRGWRLQGRVIRPAKVKISK